MEWQVKPIKKTKQKNTAIVLVVQLPDMMSHIYTFPYLTLAHYEYFNLAMAIKCSYVLWNIAVPWSSGLIYMGRTRSVQQRPFGFAYCDDSRFQRGFEAVNSWILWPSLDRKPLWIWLGRVGLDGELGHLNHCITKPVCQTESIHLFGFPT